jgi:hypothetical protein
MALDRYGQLLGGDLGAVAEQRLDAADRQADVPSEPRRPSRPSRGQNWPSNYGHMVPSARIERATHGLGIGYRVGNRPAAIIYNLCFD